MSVAVTTVDAKINKKSDIIHTSLYFSISEPYRLNGGLKMA
jgi:hypothetical protein